MALPGQGSFYPSWKVRLTIRFEEFGNVTQVANPPTITTKALNGLGGNRNTLTVVSDPANAGALLLTAAGQTQAQPATQQSSSTDGLTYDVTVIPRELDWSLNGIRTADQITTTLLFTDLPIDPRTVRSVAVEAFMGTVTEDDWLAGNAGQRRTGNTTSGQGEPLNLIPDTYVDENGLQRTNSRFQGWVDKWSVELKGDEFVIQLECTDNTRLLINQEAPPALVVSMSQPIDQAVAKYLANFPQLNGMSIQYLPVSVTTPPILKNILLNTAFRPNLGPHATNGGATTQRMSVWDYLTDICRSIGHSIRVVGTTIYIQTARNLLSSATGRREDDPYRTRTVDGVQYPYRTVIYGWNIKTLKMGRQYAKKAPTNVEVRCFPGDTVVSARDVERIYRRFYSGPAVSAYTKGAGTLTGTPNHPILTARGWVPLRELHEGDHLVGCSFGKRGSIGHPNADAGPTKLSELFDAVFDVGVSERVRTTHDDFHGDGAESEIDVVDVNGLLRNRLQSASSQPLLQSFLSKPHERLRPLHRLGALYKRAMNLITRQLFAALRVVCSFQRFFPHRYLVGAFPSELGSVTETSHRNAVTFEDSTEGDFVMPILSSDRSDRFSGEITFHEVTEVREQEFTGHVYNLQTSSGWYTAGEKGIISHNCYRTDIKQVMVARWPFNDPTKPNAGRLVNPIPGNAQPDNKWTVFNVAGIKDQTTLNLIAQSIYEELGRQEFEVEVETDDLTSFGGDNTDPDIFDMAAGDTFEIFTQRDQTDRSSVTYNETKLSALALNAQYMEKLGFSSSFANAYAKAYTNAGFLTTFRLRQMKVHCSIDDGVSFRIVGTNYLEVRMDKSLPAGQEPGTSAPTATPTLPTTNTPQSTNPYGSGGGGAGVT
jgi:hypothetical protein